MIGLSTCLAISLTISSVNARAWVEVPIKMVGLTLWMTTGRVVGKGSVGTFDRKSTAVSTHHLASSIPSGRGEQCPSRHTPRRDEHTTTERVGASCPSIRPKDRFGQCTCEATKLRISQTSLRAEDNQVGAHQNRLLASSLEIPSRSIMPSRTAVCDIQLGDQC